jgi:hypothetical protein
VRREPSRDPLRDPRRERGEDEAEVGFTCVGGVKLGEGELCLGLMLNIWIQSPTKASKRKKNIGLKRRFFIEGEMVKSERWEGGKV